MSTAYGYVSRLTSHSHKSDDGTNKNGDTQTRHALNAQEKPSNDQNPDRLIVSWCAASLFYSLRVRIKQERRFRSVHINTHTNANQFANKSHELALALALTRSRSAIDNDYDEDEK